MQPKRCDYCGDEFRFEDKARKDTQGRYYSAPGEYYLPFHCPHCHGTYCNKHRLPENHNCIPHSRPKPNLAEASRPTPRYIGNTEKRKVGAYIKGALLLSILLIIGYAAATTSLVSDVGKYVEAQIPAISSSISSLGETVTKAVTPTTVNTGDIEKLIFKYTNDERRKAGLKELVWDDQLALIAREHSADMAKNNFFSHTNLSGEDPTARAQRHGYPVRKPIGGGAYMVGIGENISKMPTGNVQGHGYISNDADSVAKAVVESWMNSPGHRANILNGGYDRLGVGVAYDGTYYYSTQDYW